MYPDLSYIIHDIVGLPPDNLWSIFKTFGLFLAMAFLVSAYVLFLELRRKEKQGLLPTRQVIKEVNKAYVIKNSLLNALILGFFAFKIPYIINHFDAFKLDPASIVFSFKGSIIIGLISFIGCFLYSYNNGLKDQDFGKTVQYNSHASNHITDITIIAAVSGLLGARLFSILENMEQFWHDPIGTLFSGSGLTIYGGLILAFITVYLYVLRLGLKPIHVMDAVAPALIAGYGVGRLGCHFSGDGDWGIANIHDKPDWLPLPDILWSYSYPRNVLNQGQMIDDCIGNYCRELVPAVYPTPVYEAFFAGLIFLLLWNLRKRINVPGMIFFIYLSLNGLERFYIEQIRVNERYELWGLNWSLSQSIGMVFLLIGLAGISVLLLKNKKAI